MRKLLVLIFVFYPFYLFGQDWSLTTDSENIEQGDVVVFQITSPRSAVENNLKLRFLERDFKVIGQEEGFVSIAAIPAAQPRRSQIIRGNDARVRLEPGLYRAELLNGGRQVASVDIQVQAGEFEEINYDRDYIGGSLSRAELEKYRREVGAMNSSKAFISNLLARNGFRDPLDEIFVTSPFAKLRTYANLPTGRAHGGTDLRAPVGTPVKSIGNGRVEYVGINHVFEGTIVIINHGGAVTSRFEGIRSYYLHLSEVLVERGQEVRRGQVIARSGDTAAPGSPHLHLAVKINDIYADFQKLKLKF